MTTTEQFPTYPIYHLKLAWVTPDGKPDGTSGRVMVRWQNHHAEAVRVAFSWAEQSAEKAGIDPLEIEIAVRFVEVEEWCLSWFSHYTFDVGQSDAEAIASFSRYVSRTEAYNRRNQERHVSDDGSVWYCDPRCLMGAEDRWRWTARGCGTSRLGTGESTGEAPCRCKDCRAAGVLRIDH
jgi:hypothetical protein